jgi:hypothetical protein
VEIFHGVLPRCDHYVNPFAVEQNIEIRVIQEGHKKMKRVKPVGYLYKDAEYL